MKPKLTFGTMKLMAGTLGEESPVPDLVGGLILQNKLEFYLDEDDELYEGYGRCQTSYPYRQYTCYSRELRETEVKTAVLENDYLKAVFLPEYGGRLWSLTDKERGRELLYTNDVLRFCNLAVRNAWFSGGVEWNLGVIGHTPLTADQLYTAVLEQEDGTKILRMYEYERIRGVTYQMDFWLGEKDRFLNARMRVVNFGEEVVPMYWWSNMAVPEEDGGRVVVPAKKAFTNKDWGVYKVDIPFVNGVDITRYQQIPESVDYFFDIPEESPKYIAHVDGGGYGLLHLSTNRLRSRKLFSWGNRPGGDHWQEFLTDQAGKYLEIQAGLAKTQYGCIPMAPHTAWEWMERYGSIQLTGEEQEMEFEELRGAVTRKVEDLEEFSQMEELLKETKAMAKEPASVVWEGSSFGALRARERSMKGLRPLSEHLAFFVQKKDQIWQDYLETGILKEPDPKEAPPAFVNSAEIFQMLKKTAAETDGWYAHYQLGILYMQEKAYEDAKEQLQASLAAGEQPWALHALAALHVLENQEDTAAALMERGLCLRMDDLAYVKEGFQILLTCQAYEAVKRIYEQLEEKLQQNGRLKLGYAFSLYQLGEADRAAGMLEENGGLVVEDIREGEDGLNALWEKTHRELSREDQEVPYHFDFKAV